MGCNCGSKKYSPSQTYVHTAPDGTKKTYKTQIEATAAAQRQGGTVRAQ